MAVYIFQSTLSIIPLSFFPLSTNLFSMSVSPPLLCKEVHQYHLSRFHMYVLIYDIFPSFWLTSLCLIGSRFIYHTRTESNTFILWPSNILLYILPLLLYPFICQWASMMLQCPSYCKQCSDEKWDAGVFFKYGFLKVYAQ